MILNNLIYRIFLSDFKENADGKPKYTIYSMEKRGAVSHIAAKINTKNKPSRNSREVIYYNIIIKDILGGIVKWQNIYY